MRHARLQKLQRFRRKMPFYSFLILCPRLLNLMHVQGEVCHKSLAKHANTYLWGVNQCAPTNSNRTNSRDRLAATAPGP